MQHWSPFAILLLLLLVQAGLQVGTATPAPAALKGIVIRGNSFVDTGTNRTVILRGVSHSSGEYLCVHATQHWHGENRVFEADITPAFVEHIKSWGNNVVRIPLNEDCWLDINGANLAGSAYKEAVANFVKLLTDAGLAVLLDLHWAAPGSKKATGQVAMPDKDHSIDFWGSVAKAFADNPLVLFELYNEPFPDNGNVKESSWKCLQTGNCNGAKSLNYKAAGMNDLVAAVRKAGATNALLVSGLVWSNHLSGWLDHVPPDPLHNVGAVWHSYSINACNNLKCWEDTVAPVAATFPVIVTESGFSGDYGRQLWSWCEKMGVSYMAWTFNTWTKEGLIEDYQTCKPSEWGKSWQAQLASIPGPSPPPPSPPTPPTPWKKCPSCQGGTCGCSWATPHTCSGKGDGSCCFECCCNKYEDDTLLV
eukprot:gnl/MRDRNA2_/MRDRNA2_34580_c0_seq1.p1 gnl/MRDRNA2_/MRDRNA2_34580_c0~~gnl/MRDRNA2_/MRDRNA2_34580_c0_seq1.p1  ORF type:complete len:421 (-),score=61.81 gnl/MRDRNA2_/MRDRNA2_34580_c0_seq1:352-1614(-)